MKCGLEWYTTPSFHSLDVTRRHEERRRKRTKVHGQRWARLWSKQTAVSVYTGERGDAYAIRPTEAVWRYSLAPCSAPLGETVKKSVLRSQVDQMVAWEMACWCEKCCHPLIVLHHDLHLMSVENRQKKPNLLAY